jgi:signal transduction histidine kinase
VLFALALAVVASYEAVTWYGRPFPGVLVDADGVVSSFGHPSWEGVQRGLRYPDRVVSIDGVELRAQRGAASTVWDAEVARAAALNQTVVRLVVATSSGIREVDLHLVPFDSMAWWFQAGGLIFIALLYIGAGLVARLASPKGKLAGTFGKASALIALFLLTVFDYHTTRALVPVFYFAFAMVPLALIELPLRLPDDVGLLRRWPRLVRVLDFVGAALAILMLANHWGGRSTVALRTVCSVLFGGASLFFGLTFLLRYAFAKGERRATMRALLAAVVPPYVVIGVASILGTLHLPGLPTGMLILPALALTPLSSIIAFVRHDLWGSRALLSRVITRALIAGFTCALAVCIGAAFAASVGVPFGGALLASAATGALTTVLVVLALGVGDRQLFPSRAAYKPTIEQLSEELTSITVPHEVASAVERTVLRWLPCEHVEFRQIAESETPDLQEGEGRQELALGVRFGKSAIGVLRVGRKHGGALYTSEDVDLLKTIANQAALALAHAMSYAELELRRRQQEQAWRGEREALVETVAAEIAHEVRYPINFFRSIFSRANEPGTRTLDPEEIDIGCEEVERLERLVSGLRRVSVRRLERRVVSVVDLVAKMELLLRDRLSGRRLELSIGESPFVRCDPDQATQVLVNLLSNALDAAGEQGVVGVTWALTGEGAILSVWDDGPGLPSDPARIFAPWYTTKPRGTGLGLAITHRLARAHGWSIDPERREGRTYFVVRIPIGDLVRLDGRDAMESDANGAASEKPKDSAANDKVVAA